MNTIHITGQSANTMPAATLSKASPTGSFHALIAMTSPTSNPARDDCQAGRRRTPSDTSTTAIGSAATKKERIRLSPTGVNN